MPDWTVTEISHLPAGQVGVGFEVTNGTAVVSFVYDGEDKAEVARKAVVAAVDAASAISLESLQRLGRGGFTVG